MIPYIIIYIIHLITMTNDFNIEQYLKKMDKIIHTVLSKKDKEVISYDILDTEKSIINKKIALKERQRQMRIGDIWQKILGNYDGFVDLHIGHKSGLDIISYEKKIIIELKNRTNTDNSSSKKTNLDKLAKFKKENPDYTCIYANINCETKSKTLDGCYKLIKYNDIELVHYTGIKFIKYILGEHTDAIIEFIKMSIDKYS